MARTNKSKNHMDCPRDYKSMEEFMKELNSITIPKSTTAALCLDRMKKLNVMVECAFRDKMVMNEFRCLHRYLKLVEYLTIITKQSPNDKMMQEETRRAKKNLIRYEEVKNIVKKMFADREKAAKEEMNAKKSLEIKKPEKNLNKGPSPKSVPWSSGYIKCNDLHSLLSDSARKENLLILDLRSAGDFKESQIRFGNVINIPENIIIPGSSASVLGNKLDASSSKLWAKRGEADVLVLADWSTSASTTSSSSKAIIMKKIMQDWDYSYKYKSPPVILDGGIEELIARYPQMLTNPKVVAPRVQPLNNNDIIDLHYPMEELEPPKPKPDPPKPANESVRPKSVPSSFKSASPDEDLPVTVNRQNKPIIKTTTTPPVNINQIAEEPAEAVSPQSDVSSLGHLTTSGGDNGDELLDPVEMDTAGPPRNVDSSTSSDDDSSDISVPQKPHHKSDDLDLKKPGSAEVEHLRKLKPTTLTRFDKKLPHDETSDITHQPLKGDGFSSGGLHRTSSSPNIAQMRDDELTHRLPAFSRANKPTPKILSPERVFRESALSRPDVTYGRTSPGLTGLKNFANNCYMNSILQCLNNTKPLVDELLSDFHLNNAGRSKGRIAHEVILTFRMMWSGDVRVFSIKELKSIMGDIKDMFKGSMHQDSNEFLIILLEHLHEELKIPADVGTLAGAVEKTGEKAWGEFRRTNCSVIQRLFYGQHKSTVMCNTCNHASETFEQFLNLFVPIPSNVNDVRLEDCIQAYMSGERINGWKCPSCKAERNAIKKFDISRLPPILVIALKRFTHENDSWLHKKENLVTYPLENLDMSRFTLPSSDQRHKVYNLYAMSTHTGTLQSGHYRAICKNYSDKKWYMFDDQNVDHLSESNVMRNSEVYILFYVAATPS